jgi:hypothetical protein
MNLVYELARTAFSWSLANSQESYEVAHKPGTMRTRATMLMTVIAEPGAVPVQHHFSVNSPLSIEHMLAHIMKAHFKEHPVLKAWLDSKGNVPVELEPHALECVGEAMHTGLRKLADSKQSIITWNALHKLHPHDRVAIWETAAKVLREAFAEGKPPTRRQLAKTLQAEIQKVTDELRWDKPRDEEGVEVERKPLQDFGLQMMYAGCALTDFDEWMWGWLGYVVKDVAKPAEMNAAETTVA